MLMYNSQAKNSKTHFYKDSTLKRTLKVQIEDDSEFYFMMNKNPLKNPQKIPNPTNQKSTPKTPKHSKKCQSCSVLF